MVMEDITHLDNATEFLFEISFRSIVFISVVDVINHAKQVFNSQQEIIIQNAIKNTIGTDIKCKESRV
jgi:hypothetical protein